ncbi:MAG: coenzyme F420-0:L-glutamate ligase [Candidatus Hodarchaeales archaeon]
MKLEFFGVKTPLITSTDSNITDIILESIKKNNLTLDNFDVLIIASKIISIIEKRIIHLSDITNIRTQALTLAKKSKLPEAFVEIVFREADEVLGAVPGAVLAFRNGILQANAGVDQSNSGGEGTVVLLPKDPIKVANELRKEIFSKTKKEVGIIIADSKTHPLRRGTSGFALGVSGILPVIDDRGKFDLYNRKMKITTRALADNLVCGAEILMGESGEQIPVVIARGCPPSVFIKNTDDKDNNRLMIMNPKQCIYMGPLWPKL